MEGNLHFYSQIQRYLAWLPLECNLGKWPPSLYHLVAKENGTLSQYIHSSPLYTRQAAVPGWYGSWEDCSHHFSVPQTASEQWEFGRIHGRCRITGLLHQHSPTANKTKINTPLTTFIIRMLCIHEVTPFRMVKYSKSYCKSCSFQSLQKPIGAPNL